MEDALADFVNLVRAFRSAQRQYERGYTQEYRFRLSTLAGMVDAFVDDWSVRWEKPLEPRTAEGVPG